MKGHFGQECNRTACNELFAFYFNHSTRKYYCVKCARLINNMNRVEAMKLFGHDLCTLVSNPEDIKE